MESSASDFHPSNPSSPAQPHVTPKKALHSKRSFHKHGLGAGLVDSPAYDASEEDNDPATDDGASSTGPVVSKRSTANAHSGMKSSMIQKKYQSMAADAEDPGVDSPTYDGDIESSTAPHPHSSLSPPHEQYSSSENTASTLMSSTSQPVLPPSGTSFAPVTPSPLAKAQFASGAGATIVFDPVTATAQEIQAWVESIIAGTNNDCVRNYKMNPAPEGRPAIVYADGVYDLFHHGHALQLKQCKLAFPSVHLLVGIPSDETVKANKANTIMSHDERCEAVKHCKWVDGVVPDAPWLITNDLLAKHNIDYIAHDESPYPVAAGDDLYAVVKDQGKFLPTRRTPGVSTSSLLARILTQYRTGYFNSKLKMNGNVDLMWQDGSNNSSA